jgi:hypothetical protein
LPDVVTAGSGNGRACRKLTAGQRPLLHQLAKLLSS